LYSKMLIFNTFSLNRYLGLHYVTFASDQISN